MVKCQKIVNLMAIVVRRPEASDDQEEDGQSRWDTIAADGRFGSGAILME